MKREALVVGLVLLGMAGSGLLPGLEAAPAKPRPPRVAVRGLDPIAFIGGDSIRGRSDLFHDHKQLRYLFANEKNRSAFKKEPDRYAIQGDGTCPFDPASPADPNIVMLYKGKIYAFASVGCLVPFGENPERYLARWPGNPDRKKKNGP